MKKCKIICLCVSMLLLVGCGTKPVSNNIGQDPIENQSLKNTQVQLDKENALIVDYEDKNYKEIFDCFKKDETKANNEYLKKTVKITGEISSIENKDEYIIISIMSDNHYHMADIYLENNDGNKEKIEDLKEWGRNTRQDDDGNVITVYGIFEEFEKLSNGNYIIKITDGEFA